MIRVALVIGRLNVGGAEGELLRLATRLDRSRFEPFVVTLLDRGPRAAGVRGVEIVELGRRRKWSPGTYGALKRLLLERKPDIVQSFLFTENVFCRWIGQGIVVSGLRGAIDESAETGRSWKRHLERWTFGRARAVVSNSSYYRDLYAKLGLDASKIEVIPNGVEPFDPAVTGAGVRKALGFGPDQVMIGCVARLVELKGHEDVIRATAGFRPVFVGDGSYRRRLEGRGAILAGERADAAEFVAASDIVVLASRFGESLPNAVLEAMAAGKPVVATRVGGVAEAVVDGETGILVRPGDVPALREAIVRLAGDPALRQRLGAAGRERVAREFPVEKMVASYEALYSRLVGRSR